MCASQMWDGCMLELFTWVRLLVVFTYAVDSRCEQW